MSNSFFPAVQYLQQYQPENILTLAQKAQEISAQRQAQAQAAALQPGQLQAQNLQNLLGQQEVQQRQQALDDQKALTRGMQEWDGKNIEELPGLVLKHGGSATAVLGLKQQVITQKTALTKLSTDELANQSAYNDQLLGKVQAAAEGDDAGLPQRLASIQADPQHAQVLQQLSSLPPDQIRAHLPLVEKELMGAKEQFSQENQRRETDAKQLQAQADMLKAQSGNLDMQEARAWMAKNPGKDLADFLRFKATLVPQFTFNLQNAGGAASGPNDPLVQAVANGNMKIGDAITPRTPLAMRKQFLGAVLQANPNFDSRTYDVEKGVMKEFTSGDAAKNLTAFNTAIEHANQLSKAADALDNGDVRALNAIGNQLGYQFGSDKVTNFNVIKNALSGEISKVFKGGQATDAEIRQVEAPFSSANSPAQLKGAINNAVALMNSKRDALKQQYEAGRQGQPNFGGAPKAGFQVPVGAPPAPAQDNKVLKQGGQIVAKSKGGQWIAPDSQ